MDCLSIDEVVRRDLATVWRVLRRAGVAEADCDDLCQEVFVTYALREKAVQPGSERAFAVGIAMRKAAEYRRSRRRRRSVVLDEIPSLAHWRTDVEAVPEPVSRETPPDRAVEQQEAVLLLEELLGTLALDFREVFILVEVEQLAPKEAAAALGISEGTLASRLHRARKKFDMALARCRFVEKVGNDGR